ncbi:MAG: hypothetical protein AAFX58_09405 [Pseudomonadota bacterium]
MHTFRGRCHCGNLHYETTTAIAAGDIRARACDCRFCRLHGARNWSDPGGSTAIAIADETQLRRYRFALKTADFLICKRCGVYLGAVLEAGDGCWSTINLRLADLDPVVETASFGHEDTAGRVDRRRRVWTPTTVAYGDGHG